MSGELDYNEQGEANMLIVGHTAWHKEGHVLPDHPGYREALAIAELDYNVETRPAWFESKTPDGDTFQKRAHGQIVVRTDREEPLALVGNQYHVIPNGDAFAPFEPLVDDGRAMIQTAGVLRNGGDAWMLVKWNLNAFNPATRFLFDGTTEAFGLIAANHTGRRGVLLKDTPVEVVCANTLGAAEESSGVVVAHRAKGSERMQNAADTLWGSLLTRYDRIAESYDLLKHATITGRHFEACVLRIIAPVTRLRAESPLAPVVAERVSKQWESLTRLWHEGKGNTGNHSAWEAYMAATEALDHDPDGVFPTRGSRVKQLLDGHLATKKTQVLRALLVAAA